ncbi:hypothetical protein H0H93_010881 [Arthromyces matolae]|nr:hypothetical protein H0H93_010881 [Arthromyces matolae]
MTLLLNTSGAGKTRLILQGLCKQWGFYFTCKRNSDEVGSSDIQSIIRPEGCLNQQGIIPDLSNAPSVVEALADNEQIANRCFSAAMVSRILVFSCFLRTFKLRGRNMDILLLKARWLLLQLDTSLLGTNTQIGDVFQELTGILSTIIDRKELTRLGQRLLHACRQECQMLEPSAAIYCVVDEAQAGVEAWAKSFRDQTMEDSRPVLRAMLRHWREAYQMSTVVTGTSINRAHIIEALSSTIGKQSDQQDINDTGSWGDNTTIENYLRKYIPDTYLATPEGVELICRARYWLWGRPRFIAAYVQLVIQNNFKSYHRLLSYTVKEISKFTPNDAESWETLEPPIKTSTPRLSPFDYQRLPKIHAKLQSAVTQLTYERFMGRNLNSVPVIDHELVQCGFARFPGNTVGDTRPKMDEPLAYLAADIWLNMQEDHRDIRHDYWEKFTGYDNHVTNGFERYAALLIADVFKEYRTISDVFDLHEPGISRNLSTQKARLVSCWRDTSDVLKFAPFVYPLQNREFDGQLIDGPRAPSHTLGSKSMSKRDKYIKDLTWLNGDDRSPFLFPMQQFGPDLIFRLLLEDSQKIITVALQTKYMELSSSCTSTVILKALRTVTPKLFWNAGDQATLGDDVLTGPKSLRIATRQILNEFGHRYRNDEKSYSSILRAFLFFPVVDNDATSKDILETVKKHTPQPHDQKDNDDPAETDAPYSTATFLDLLEQRSQSIADNGDPNLSHPTSDVTMADGTAVYPQTRLNVDVQMGDFTPSISEESAVVYDHHDFGVITATKLLGVLGGRAEKALRLRMQCAQQKAEEQPLPTREIDGVVRSIPSTAHGNGSSGPYYNLRSRNKLTDHASVSPIFQNIKDRLKDKKNTRSVPVHRMRKLELREELSRHRQLEEFVHNVSRGTGTVEYQTPNPSGMTVEQMRSFLKEADARVKERFNLYYD